MSALPDGLYDRLIAGQLLKEVEALLRENQASERRLSAVERRRRLADLVASQIVDLLDDLKGDDGARAAEELAIVSQVLARLREPLREEQSPILPLSDRALTSVHRRSPAPTPPDTGLSDAWLFTAGRGAPALLEELRRELAAADEVDVLVSFIKWSGLRKLWDILQSATALGADGRPRRRLRFLTTTYMAVTEPAALQKLAELPGVEVRVSLDSRRSRLHAKAWIFRRASDHGSAYVGSANLSASALAGGLEWTVKFTQVGQPDLFTTANAHFETLWNDREFVPVDLADPGSLDRLRDALHVERLKGGVSPTTLFALDPKP